LLIISVPERYAASFAKPKRRVYFRLHAHRTRACAGRETVPSNDARANKVNGLSHPWEAQRRDEGDLGRM
jgi:hypothetical protein